MYCTKLLHHTYTKIRTLSCRGNVERRGIFETEKHTTLYKTWLSPPADDFLSPFCFSPPKTRVRFDSAFKSPVPQETTKAEEQSPPPSPSPPPRSSSSSSSSGEAPVKQKAEQSGTQAPPQRALVPLVSLILEQQIRTERAQVRDRSPERIHRRAVWVCCELYLCSAETHADGGRAGKGQLSRRQDKTRHQNNADIFKTVCVCPQQQEADWRPFERR